MVESQLIFLNSFLSFSLISKFLGQVEIFDGESHELLKTVSAFKRQAYSGSFRCDGALLVAGGEEGFVKVFEVKSKSLLRTFRTSKR